MGSLKILLPAREVLDQFSSIVEPMLSRITASRREDILLAATRDLLLPKLTSGEIRLREAEALAEAAQ